MYRVFSSSKVEYYLKYGCQLEIKIFCSCGSFASEVAQDVLTDRVAGTSGSQTHVCYSQTVRLVRTQN